MNILIVIYLISLLCCFLNLEELIIASESIGDYPRSVTVIALTLIVFLPILNSFFAYLYLYDLYLDLKLRYVFWKALKILDKLEKKLKNSQNHEE